MMKVIGSILWVKRVRGQHGCDDSSHATENLASGEERRLMINRHKVRNDLENVRHLGTNIKLQNREEYASK